MLKHVQMKFLNQKSGISYQNINSFVNFTILFDLHLHGTYVSIAIKFIDHDVDMTS